MAYGNSIILQSLAQPAINTAIYASGDALGTLLTFRGAVNPSCPGGIITGLTLADYDSQNVAIDVLLFSHTVASGTNNAAYTPVWADFRDYRIGVLSIAVADYVGFTARSIATVHSKTLTFKSLDPVGNIYAQMVVRGTPTYTLTTSLSIALHILRDG